MLSENQRGILYMVAACTGFIVNDTMVKLASEDISIPQTIVLRSVFALPVVLFFCWQQGALANLLALGDRHLWWRTLGELGGTALYLTALARMEIANTTTYGNFFNLPGADLYTIRLTIQRLGSQRPVVLDFKYDHRRS